MLPRATDISNLSKKPPFYVALNLSRINKKFLWGSKSSFMKDGCSFYSRRTKCIWTHTSWFS